MTASALITSTYLDKKRKGNNSVSISQFGEADLLVRENLQNNALKYLLKGRSVDLYQCMSSAFVPESRKEK